MSTINQLIERFQLQPHPEGGYFAETYRSHGEITAAALPQAYQGNRNFATAIYFLLTSDTFSAFHKIKQDEAWHFYGGSALTLYIISPSGELSEHRIGNDFEAGEVPQFVVPGNHWFAAKTMERNSYSFVGCTVSPGFDFADFELPKRAELLEKFPMHKAVITLFTRE